MSGTIRLVGPGGAGKSTIGALLAARLETPFIDLDASFFEREGNISAYLERYGYAAYARTNVEVYRSIPPADGGVIALSSGFMTDVADIHQTYAEVRASIAASPTTFVLLPSLDLDTCVAEIVRRQVRRPFGLVASREESKIRHRFSIYMASPALKVETMRLPEAVVTDIVARVPPDVIPKATA